MHHHLFLSVYEPDLLFVTETWLTDKITDAEILANFPYRVFRADRGNRKGGGVCCLAKISISLTVVHGPACLKSDLLCLDVFDITCSLAFRVVLVYRPPNSNAHEDDALIDAMLELCLANNHLIVLGDFNLNIGLGCQVWTQKRILRKRIL